MHPDSASVRVLEELGQRVRQVRGRDFSPWRPVPAKVGAHLAGLGLVEVRPLRFTDHLSGLGPGRRPPVEARLTPAGIATWRAR